VSNAPVGQADGLNLLGRLLQSLRPCRAGKLIGIFHLLLQRLLIVRIRGFATRSRPTEACLQIRRQISRIDKPPQVTAHSLLHRFRLFGLLENDLRFDT
jgi:hypothetical protein